MRLKNKHIKYSAIGLISIIGIIILFGLGIYYYQWRSGFVAALSRIIPYPAIIIDWEFVPYYTYADDLNTLLQYWDFQRDNSNVFLGIPSNKEIRERLVDKFIQEKIVQIWARKNNMAVTKEEVALEWERLNSQTSGPEEIDQFLDEAYGWSDEQFKKRVLIPFLLQQKVQSVLSKEHEADDEGLKERAEQVYFMTQIQGADFGSLAKEYSEDGNSARNGGDLGYFERGTFDPALESVIFSMDIGQISEPVKSSFGYHVIKLEDLLYNEEAVATQANIGHILIRTFNFEEWISAQKQDIAIYRLVL